MKSAAGFFLALFAAIVPLVAVPAHTQTFADPANLRGERVKPCDGRELPIDGGGQGNAALGLQQMLRKLNTRASLMLIVAHPDDEDGGMLTLYSRGFGARVAMLTLNRGEGGQNAMTGDFEDALGLLRTQELLAADRYLGVDQMFGTEVDFGFSKTKEESFQKWTHDRVLYDAVRAIRLYRPLVIASVFIGGVTDGHGQHQVSGQITQEAFKAAGDPDVFPELTREGILPWQPLKVYARVPTQSITPRGLFDYATGQYVPASFTNYVTGEESKTPPAIDTVVHEGTLDPLLTYGAANPEDLQENPGPAAQLTYVQFARIGLGLQKSQIGDDARQPGPGAYDIAYHLYGSCLPDSSTPANFCHLPRVSPQDTQSSASRPALANDGFFSGTDTSLGSLVQSVPSASPVLVANLRQAVDQIAAATASAATTPAATLGQLAEAASRLQALIAEADAESFDATEKANLLHELRVKSVQVNEALGLVLGLQLDATAHGVDLPVDSQPVVSTTLRVATASTFTLAREWLENSAGDIHETESARPLDTVLSADRPFTRTLRSAPVSSLDRKTANQANLSLSVTRPYFDRDSIEAPVYRLLVPGLRNAAETPHALVAWATLDYRGVPVTVGRVVHDGAQPVLFVPALNVHLVTSALATFAPLHAQVFRLGRPGEPSLPAYVAISRQPVNQPVREEKLVAPGGWKATTAIGDTDPAGKLPFQLHAPAGAPGTTVFQASVAAQAGTYTGGWQSVGYADLPRTNYFTIATDHVVPVAFELPTRKRIAYLPGTGDAVPESLASIGLAPTIITVSDLTPEKLAVYDAVVLGVRTYAAHADLHGAPTQALLDYVRNGGNVVVQYQTAEFSGADAPYPLALGRDAEKVVDETAPVQMLDATASLLTSPNSITSADFNGWVEERGHGYLRTWDSRYDALLETHDPGSVTEGVAPQQPQRGGLITTPLGRGRWTYCAFAIYRQLPEAVPGAYRLLMNLLEPIS